MHITPTFTAAAMRRWAQIPDHAKEAILAEVWCGQCCTGISIKDSSGALHSSGDVILRGVCGICGHKVCRVIGTGETMGLPDEFP